MSRDYCVITTLKIQYNNQNIKKIMYKAATLGFIYYDFISGERYQESPIMTAAEAFQKLLQLKEEANFFDSLFVKIEKNYFPHMWFYKSDAGLLQYQLGSFYNIKEKIVEDSCTIIDLKFYIDAALKLGDDFGIEKLIADYTD